MRRVIVPCILAATLAALDASTPAAAQMRRCPIVPCGEVALVPGAEVIRRCQCGVTVSWEARGFTYGNHPELARAWAFGGDGVERIVAGAGAAVMYTNDRGLRWELATWPSVGPVTGEATVGSIVLEPSGRFGIATLGGAIYTTSDAGGSWSYLRTIPDAALTVAQLLGRHAALTEPRGGVWLLIQGGELVTLVEPGDLGAPLGAARVTAEHDAMRIDSAHGAWRLQRNGTWAPVGGP